MLSFLRQILVWFLLLALIACGNSSKLLPPTNISPQNDFRSVATSGGTWTEKAPMPTARVDFGTEAINGNLYAVGGEIFSGPGDTNVLEIYNPVTDSWHTAAPMPTLRLGVATASLGGRLYVAGGVHLSMTNPILKTLEVYDPLTDDWSTEAPMITPRDGAAGAALDGLFYVVGGEYNFADLASVEAYSPLTNSWSPKAPMSLPREFLTLSVVSGKLYAIGGATQSNGTNEDPLRLVEAYDPLTDTWTRKARMPIPLFSIASGVINGVIYVVGGESFETLFYCTVEAYDPKTDTWTMKASMPTGRLGLGAGVIKNTLFAVGGQGAGPNTVLHTNEAFTP